MFRANSPSKRVADDWNPCSRVTVLSALKETRKRSFVIDEDEDELMRPTKRCVKQDCIHPSADFLGVLFFFGGVGGEGWSGRGGTHYQNVWYLTVCMKAGKHALR